MRCHHAAGIRVPDAASMGPQLVRCGMFGSPAYFSLMGMLQWGRNLFVAECDGSSSEPTASQRASMGPQLVRCGMGRRDRGPRGPGNRLQWGRNLFVAECPRWKPPMPENRSCFNGAATCSLRNAVEVVPDAPPVLVASMGPQLVRCGMADAAEKSTMRCSGFNGAATCSLRNDTPTDKFAANVLKLQWGRNLFVAECGSLVYGGKIPPIGFNGAATCSLRNAVEKSSRTLWR